MKISADYIEMIAPDDWHVHLRDNDDLTNIVYWTAKTFRRAIVMPNIVPPATSIAAVNAYHERIIAAVPNNVTFTPLMTIYLTEHTKADEVVRGFESGAFVAAKLYPAHATTNSAHGVTSIRSLWPVFEAMQKVGMPLLVHGEVTDPAVDVFDREAVFIEKELRGIVKAFPDLKVVFEHITTKEAVEFVRASKNVGATITAHHLLINRNHMFLGGIRPHNYCLPVAKREAHRMALVAAATSGDAKFFLGTDSAPHAQEKKESSCGCAGIYSACGALAHYLEVFAAEKKLEQFEAFASINGAKFYGLPVNQEKVRIKKAAWKMPDTLPLSEQRVVIPFRAGESIAWHAEVQYL